MTGKDRTVIVPDTIRKVPIFAILATLVIVSGLIIIVGGATASYPVSISASDGEKLELSTRSTILGDVELHVSFDKSVGITKIGILDEHGELLSEKSVFPSSSSESIWIQPEQEYTLIAVDDGEVVSSVKFEVEMRYFWDTIFKS